MPYRKAWEVAYQRDRAAGISRYVDAEPTRTRLAGWPPGTCRCGLWPEPRG